MTRPAPRTALAALLAASAAACASEPPRMYHWTGYDEALFRHYRSPDDREAFVAALRRIVAGAERRGRRAPPGIYAEYGYALYEEGRYPEAIAWFQKEKATWPESTVLMDKMIRNAGGRAPAATRGPAGALEERR